MVVFGLGDSERVGTHDVPVTAAPVLQPIAPTPTPFAPTPVAPPASRRRRPSRHQKRPSPSSAAANRRAAHVAEPRVTGSPPLS